ncbi:MAG: mycothiol system anti-sigma-R factor [Nitriliruptorales bacterium]|nr:mycothiol system anti-sigma-R factor [Nitriliruptorales bacterium]
MDDSCRQVLRELQMFLDGESADELQHIISRHLGDCGPCHDQVEFQREVRVLIAAKCTDCAPPGLMERVCATLWPS